MDSQIEDGKPLSFASLCICKTKRGKEKREQWQLLDFQFAISIIPNFLFVWPLTGTDGVRINLPVSPILCIPTSTQVKVQEKDMSSSICTPNSLLSYTRLKPNTNTLQSLLPKRLSTLSVTPRASLSIPKEAVLKSFHERRALKIISGLQNFNKDNVASVVIAADKGGATHVDIACDPELVKLVTGLTSLPVCVSSVDPSAFLAAVEAGASMVEIGNYDSFYEAGIVFSPDQILNLTVETRRILPLVALSVTVPHTLSLPDQAKLAEQLQQEGVDIIQTEGGKCSNPSKPGVLGLIEKANPTLAAAYTISRAVQIPVMCASGLSAVTAPMAITAGASGVGVGSAINKLNDVVAMIAEVRSIADSLGLTVNSGSELENRALRV
ncbi:hypothetical protein L1887_33857 [Cichorium endivia]|nr:hypothetical protein L1887_33857 [Cichorium endivia]